MIVRFRGIIAAAVWAGFAIVPLAPAHEQRADQDARPAPLGAVDDDLIERLIEWFVLDETQADDAFRLHDTYREDLAAARVVLAERMENAEINASDDDDWGGSAEELETLRALLADHRRTARERLFRDVQILLDRDQLLRWPSWERAMLRWDQQPQVPFRSAQVDLVELVDQAPLTEEERELASTMLESYEAELDGAIVTWVERRDATILRLDAMERYDPERAVRVMRPALREAWAIGEINRRHLAEISEAVGERGAPGLREAFDRAAYEGLFRARYFDTALSTALELDTLDADQLEALIVLDEEHHRRGLVLIHRQARAFEAMEREALNAPARPEDARRHYALLEGRATGMRLESGDAVRDFAVVEQARRSLDNELIPRLFRLLTVEQRHALPVRTPASEGRPLTGHEIEMIRPLYIDGDEEPPAQQAPSEDNGE